MQHQQEPPDLLTPAEVAALFKVTPVQVMRWAQKGRLPFIRTLGGHRRFPRAAVLELRSKPGDPR